MPSWFVIAMGLGTVFIGLICIIILCKILGAVCSIAENKNQSVAAPVAATAPAAVSAPIQNQAPAKNRGEIIAAIGAVIAEDCGVDAKAIRILSIKKI